jgi:thymidine phosphorylase
VGSLDLITASILSKKLAAGLEGLVLDVKLGSGAFMKTPADARALAGALVETANAAGCPARALVSDMSQPLAPAVGNALEVAAALRVLTGEAEGPLAEVSAALGGAVLAGAGLAEGPEEGACHIARAIARGEAAERFGRMVAGLGGPVQFVDCWPRFLPEAAVIRELAADRDGYVAGMDGEAMGLAVIDLGGGRRVETDGIDPAVGLDQVVRLGTQVHAGQPLLRIHAARTEQADRAEAALRRAITIAPSPPTVPPLIHERLG